MPGNLTVGRPTRVIVLFTLPLLIGNLFQQFYQFTDAAVVGRMVGVDALGAVGSTGSLTFLLLGFTFGLAAGLAIPVARAFGAGDLPAMRRHVAIGVRVAAAVAVLLTLIGTLGARWVLELMQTPPELLADATTFLKISCLGVPVVMAFNFLAAVIRALGDSRTPLVFLVISCLLNAGLVVLFVGPFDMGVAGAAWATMLAQFISVLLCVWLVVRRMPQLHLHRGDWTPLPGEVAESIGPGLTMGLQMSVIAIGAVILQAAVNGLGPDAVAAMTAAMRVDQVAVAPLSSFGIALSTYVAQNRGAGQWARIRVGVFHTTVLTWVLALGLGVAIIAFGEQIVGIFVGPGERTVVELAHEYLLVQGLLYPILATLFVLRNAIQGLGATAVPTVAGFMELALRAGAGLVLVAPLGFLGAALAAPLAWIGALLPVLPSWFLRRRALLRQEAEEASARAAEPVLPALAQG